MNLGMGMSLSLRHELRPAYGSSIFPDVDRLLNETRYQQGLAFVGSRKNMDRYRSMVDFLFCELFPEYRPGCFRYYRGKGPLLKELITDRQRQAFEAQMLHALEVAVIKAENREYIYWARFRREALKLAAG